MLQVCINKKLIPNILNILQPQDDSESSNQETEQKPKPFSEFHAFTRGHRWKFSDTSERSPWIRIRCVFSWFAKTHRIHGTGIFTNIYHTHQLNVSIKWDVFQKLVGVFPPNHPLKKSGFPFINPTIFGGVLPLFLETPKSWHVTCVCLVFPKCDTFWNGNKSGKITASLMCCCCLLPFDTFGKKCWEGKAVPSKCVLICPIGFIFSDQWHTTSAKHKSHHTMIPMIPIFIS